MRFGTFHAIALIFLIASPVLAAPGLSVAHPGALDANGNWIWRVALDPDEGLFTNPDDIPDRGLGGSLAAELGFTLGAGSPLVGTPTKNATNFPSDNTGNSPFAAPIDGEQTGIVADGNNVFAALGSQFFTTGFLKDMLTIIARGPSIGNDLNNPATRTTTINWLGAYNPDGSLGGTNGRIAQDGQDFDIFSGSASRVAIAGDADLDGSVDLDDFGALVNNFGFVGFWNRGNFNNPNGGPVGTNAIVDLDDFSLLVNRFGFTTGSGAGALATVPEPASWLLVVLVMSGLASLIRRRG